MDGGIEATQHPPHTSAVNFDLRSIFTANDKICNRNR